MRILLVRHAIAEDIRPGARNDDGARRLTADGRRKMERGAQALAALAPELALVLSSPLVRAMETAAILAAAYPKRLATSEEESLAPGGKASEVVRRLAAAAHAGAIALVGHEPNLSRLEGYLVTGHERSLAELKKGGAALIEFEGAPAAGKGTLLWHLTPAQLRGLEP